MASGRGPGTNRHIWCLVKSQRGSGTFTSVPLAKANPMAEVGVWGAQQTLPRTGRKSYWLCVRWLWKQRRRWTLYQKVPPALIGPARPPLASLSGACPSKPKPGKGSSKRVLPVGTWVPEEMEGGRRGWAGHAHLPASQSEFLCEWKHDRRPRVLP